MKYVEMHYLVDGDGEPDTFRVRAYGGVDAHHLPELVHQRTAGVTGIDGGVGLYEGHFAVGKPDLLAGAFHAAHDAEGHGAVEANRIAYGDYPVSDLPYV